MSDPRSKCRIAWNGMYQRCFSPNHPYYDSYGGRGITICDEWLDHRIFEHWAYANGIADGLSIDRIDNDGDYTPENCRWATPKQQAQNRSNTKWIEFEGLRLTQRDWSKRIGITEGALWSRLKTWPIEKALTLPLQQGKKM